MSSHMQADLFPPPELRLRFSASGDNRAGDNRAGYGADTALDAFPDGGTPFQAAGFVGAWERTRGRLAGRRTVALLGEDRDGRALAMPIEIVRRGPFRIGMFPGETHANANGPLVRPGAGGIRLEGGAIAAAARAAGLRIDALDLRRVPEPARFGEGFTVVPAIEERFAISLAGGQEAVLARGNGKRKRKRFRAQQRHFEARGGYVSADVPRERRDEALAVFLAQKTARFRGLGLPDPFSDRGIADFLHALYSDTGIDARLYAIESRGVFKAMMGGIVAAGTFWGMFSSFSDDEDAAASPGELLLWHLVETLSAEGVHMLDLGPGEERYKRSWCDVEVPQYDLTAALTAAGRVYVALAARQRAAERFVKRDERFRGAAQRLRRLVRRS